MIFKRNKKYYSLLKKVNNYRWECTNPLFICGDKGLFPVYKASGKYGILNKNHHELILKDIDNNLKEDKEDEFGGL